MSKVIDNKIVPCPDRPDYTIMEQQARKGMNIRCAGEQSEHADGSVTKGKDYKVLRGQEDGLGWDEAEILDDEGKPYIAQLNHEDEPVVCGFIPFFRIVHDDDFVDNK
ncbi:hypothetical protein PHYNN_247 [Pantoea phage Phynn]|nr:hypothetical protein PHYNN_247 [Pantoea phage Phynn]